MGLLPNCAQKIAFKKFVKIDKNYPLNDFSIINKHVNKCVNFTNFLSAIS